MMEFYILIVLFILSICSWGVDAQYNATATPTTNATAAPTAGPTEAKIYEISFSFELEGDQANTTFSNATQNEIIDGIASALGVANGQVEITIVWLDRRRLMSEDNFHRSLSSTYMIIVTIVDLDSSEATTISSTVEATSGATALTAVLTSAGVDTSSITISSVSITTTTATATVTATTTSSLRRAGRGSCDNHCSGHGSCSIYGKCVCYTRLNGDPAWTEHDCSRRTCPKGLAWSWPATAANEAHPDKECSNMGICDRSTGECQCFDGFEGIACERSVCPNECLDRGICHTQKQLATEASKEYDTPWDAMKIQGCVCDLGYRGPDCSLQECPSGPDILEGPGNESGQDCSGRGLCNYESGLCQCFSGYFGTKCQYQTVLI